MIVKQKKRADVFWYDGQPFLWEEHFSNLDIVNQATPNNGKELHISLVGYRLGLQMYTLQMSSRKLRLINLIYREMSHKNQQRSKFYLEFFVLSIQEFNQWSSRTKGDIYKVESHLRSSCLLGKCHENGGSIRLMRKCWHVCR